ncbi:hypothetical protein ElyMa_003868500 [Elysia marginata]|uniref:Uncharacterized protein n=1 Tax=Elysia marginata TaxID=1093978 RepID=A0AAV4FMA7_9GAST|nr:hypothetical protein ElyMa_003868500 [Elysia marginata]
MPKQTSTLEACSWVPIFQVGGLEKVRVYNAFPRQFANMAWSGIKPATSRSRVRRANHSATLPLRGVVRKIKTVVVIKKKENKKRRRQKKKKKKQQQE